MGKAGATVMRPSTSKRNGILKELQQIPGVGKSIAEDLYELGIESISDLKNHDPEKLFHKRCVQTGVSQDRCLLYVFRCAVYYAMTKKPDPELLKWWNWKDRRG
jgi:hypothetical protein